MENEIVVIEKETTDITKQATEIVISSQPQYEGAGAFLKAIKGLQDKIKATFDPIVNAAHLAHKEATTKRKEHLGPAIQAEGMVKQKMLTYQQEQERIRREREDKLRRQAAAEEERKRKALEERARKAAEKGKLEKAEELRDKKEEVFVPAPIVPSQVDKIEGISTKKVWKFSIVDTKAIPRDYLTPDVQKIGQVARATKGTLEIPGVRIYSEEVIASGR